MPIQGLIPETKGTGFPRIGKFHKGLPKQVKTNAKGEPYEVVGRDTDYFRVEFSEGYEYLAPLFKQMFGPQPRSIPIKLNADTVDEIFDFWREEWDGAGTLLHRCDGKKQVVTYDKDDGYFKHDQRLCAAPACKCAPVARLEVIIPSFFEATGVLGTFTVETHSEQDMRTLYARLSSFQAMVGTLRGIPLHLYREKRQTNAPEMVMVEGPQKGKKVAKRTGKRIKVPRAMLDIQLDPQVTKDTLIPALASTAFSTISPMFEKPTQHPVLVAAVHQGNQAQLALSSGPKRLTAVPMVALPQSDETVIEPASDEAPVDTPAPKKQKPSWWNAVVKTASAGMNDSDYEDLRKAVKGLLDDGKLTHAMSEKEAYDAVVALLFKPAVQAMIEAREEDEIVIDDDAATAAAKDLDEMPE